MFFDDRKKVCPVPHLYWDQVVPSFKIYGRGLVRFCVDGR